MPKRSSEEETVSDNKGRVSRRRLENAPPVENISDLIKVGKSCKRYQNINSLLLWKILEDLEDLDKLIGLEDLKTSILNQILYYLQNLHLRNYGNEYLHTMIYGSPGSGKTTVAKIIANIYRNLGILSPDGPFRIAHRDDFIAGYLGQTAIKTQKLLKSCIGGVLFIDEIYSLAPKENDKDSFSKEAIDTLNAFLSEYKDVFCCIGAGYEDEVNNCFFNMNKGLERRFQWTHKIERYSVDDLVRIFLKMIREIFWDCTIPQTKLQEILHDNYELFTNQAGDMEILLTKCKIRHSRNLLSDPNKKVKFNIDLNDLNDGILEFKKHKKLPEKVESIIDNMYM